MPDIIGKIHSFETFGAVDGPGIRFVVFMQGCPLRCLYCHNPDTWDLSGGTDYTADTLVRKILEYKSFLSKGGVTFSGGEPMLQAEFVSKAATLLKEQGVHIAIDTSGSIPIRKCSHAIDIADLILLDIKDIDKDGCYTLTGQDNKNAFALLDYCEDIKKPVWIRHVLLKDYTLAEEKLRRLCERLKAYSCIEKVELLPFHKMGEFKWESLGEDYRLKETLPPSPEEIVYAKEIVKEYALPIE